MQMMLKACEDFGSRNNLLFSTDPDPIKSNTKCLFMCGRKRLNRPAPLSLYGRDLPFVSTASHLGNVLCQDGSMEMDVREKTAGFITRSLLVREQFSFAHPMEVLKAVRVHCCDHYGSMLWDMGHARGLSKEVLQLLEDLYQACLGSPKGNSQLFP